MKKIYSGVSICRDVSIYVEVCQLDQPVDMPNYRMKMQTYVRTLSDPDTAMLVQSQYEASHIDFDKMSDVQKEMHVSECLKTWYFGEPHNMQMGPKVMDLDGRKQISWDDVEPLEYAGHDFGKKLVADAKAGERIKVPGCSHCDDVGCTRKVSAGSDLWYCEHEKDRMDKFHGKRP